MDMTPLERLGFTDKAHQAATETIAKDRFHWVPTDKQFADGLTKDDKALRERFTLWLRSPFAQLRAQ